MAKRKRLTLESRPDMAHPALTSISGMRPLPPIAGMAGDAALSAAAEELADTLHQARRDGRMVMDLVLTDIDTDYLVRDRISADATEMTTLLDSLRARGQQTPIEVAALPEGRFGLISGWRRFNALRQLYQETGDSQFATVKALIRRPRDASDAYLSMVEENEIRVGLSYYERARIVARTVEQGVYPDTGTALRVLFRAASRPKLSKIRSFLSIVRDLDDVLRFPETIGERLGLRLAQGLERDAGLLARLVSDLVAARSEDAADEQARLDAALRHKTPAPDLTPGFTVIEPKPGIRLETSRNGTLTLSGSGVDSALRARLLDWLERGG